MADSTISALPTLNGATVDDTGDFLVIVDTSTNQTKRITRAQLVTALSLLDLVANNPSIDFEDTDSGNTASIVLDNTGLRVDVNGVSNALRIDGAGASGTFTTTDGKTVTVANGIVTNIT